MQELSLILPMKEYFKNIFILKNKLIKQQILKLNLELLKTFQITNKNNYGLHALFSQNWMEKLEMLIQISIQAQFQIFQVLWQFKKSKFMKLSIYIRYLFYLIDFIKIFQELWSILQFKSQQVSLSKIRYKRYYFQVFEIK
ncbi:hypothetical protein PPERSA_08557 [Pseudocohnilembus persalinus]|uniref:Uncharacterized protein n=1 Tax=Pseudocohnilembus persalinus TaxID=266149 RepID=A0A0V0R730_PSEPJ|nr:hypothetical protein PPERSA_08557 [Pseudocohnilembus persalinus]|eukprot:KRX10154.1 hypothetical protein PPERSA_08557 [Pseudocohnilembus persalinus]